MKIFQAERFLMSSVKHCAGMEFSLVHIAGQDQDPSIGCQLLSLFDNPLQRPHAVMVVPAATGRVRLQM
jgi:hypothetical protein